MNLQGRSAIITGANQGLGRVIASHFVRAGASVLLMARGEALLRQVAAELEPFVKQHGQRILVFPGNVAVADQCRDAMALAQRELDNCCILVNNAGIHGPMGSIEDVDWNAWVQAIEVNLFGTALMCRALIPHLRARQYGKIINLSGGGATSPMPGISAYAASKAAVVRLTETLAHELRTAHVDVNAVAPGAMNTRLLDEVLAAGPAKVGKDYYERMLKLQADGGVPPDKGAALTTYLASAQSDGISGRLFSAVWDDWPRLAQKRELLAKSDIYTLRRITPEDRGLQWNCA